MALSYSEQKRIAARYGEAAYGLAEEAGKAEDVSAALMALAEASQSHEGLKKAMHNPLLPSDALMAVCEALLKSAKAPQVAIEIVSAIIQGGRGALLPFIAEAFLARLDAAQGIRRGEVMSASPLDEKTKAAIEKALSSKDEKVVLSAREDASLLGGVRVKLGSQMIDASVAGQLARLEAQLKQPADAAA